MVWIKVEKHRLKLIEVKFEIKDSKKLINSKTD